MSKDKKETNAYNPSEIESKYQKIWEEKGIYQPDLQKATRPFFNLMMFPYPSAEGLHIGNMYAFCGADIFGRFKRMQGFNVFEPIGLDGFGIHSENYAIKVGEHPKKVAARTEVNFYRQLKASGNGYAWKNTVETYNPNYYKWTQWLFIQMFKAGLAYKKGAPVNFCPSCKTVLADEQVIQKAESGKRKAESEEIRSGVCERCGSEVEIKKLEQWFFRITAYAQKLLDNLKKINWPQKILLGQKNWIGESRGAEIVFKVEGKDTPIKVFTTRVDTAYGVTALVLAPDKLGTDGKTPLALELATVDYKEKIEQYLKEVKSQLSRLHLPSAKADGGQAKVKSNSEDEKTGVFTGAYAINPFSGEKIPVWVANYVVGWYGTGALMVVPAHDERDFEFAKKYKLPVKPVIKTTHKAKAIVLQRSVNAQFIEEMRRLKIPITISAKGNYQILLKPIEIDKFISTVKQYLKKNYWVEIVGARTIFIFGDGEQVELTSQEQEIKVFEKCKVLEKNVRSALNLWDMLTEVDWYKDVITTLEYGVLINSGEFSGLTSEEAVKKMTTFLADTNSGAAYTQYKLRDWIISRQRYWGAPIPMVFCQDCAKNGKSWFSVEKAKHTLGNSKFKIQSSKLIENWKLEIENSAAEAAVGWFPVPEDQLPVLLPEVADWQPKGTGQSPLASVDEFVYTTCPNCGEPAERETDVCDTFLDSSWYYLRYPSVKNTSDGGPDRSVGDSSEVNEDLPWDLEITQKWLPVSQYTGGAEHTVLHLLYSRFVTMALHDMGYLNFDEPFPNFFAHGLIIREGAKMSKSKGNIVVPDEYIKKYGVDSLRCYLMFLGPFDAGGDFRDSGIHGMFKFLKRIWKLCSAPAKPGTVRYLAKQDNVTTPELKVMLHKTIKKVTGDIAKFKYNTSLAFLMEFTNSWERKVQNLALADMVAFLKLLAPFAPHLTEELYQDLRFKNDDLRIEEDFKSIHLESWPVYDESLLVEEKVTIVVQINGKLRAQLEVPRDFAHDREQIIEAALKNESVTKYIKDPLQAKKIIFVPGRLINFVV